MPLRIVKTAAQFRPYELAKRSKPAIAATAPTANERIAISLFELSESTGICQSKLREEVAAGRLLASKIGTRLIVSRAAVDGWLALTSRGTRP